MKKIFCLILVCCLCGCAGFGQLKPESAIKANNAVATATGLLHVLNGFYGDLVTLKMAPDYQVEATRALSIADAAAKSLNDIIAGSVVTDAQMNVVAGQVSGAQAILQTAKK
jgi:hypothetical protein